MKKYAIVVAVLMIAVLASFPFAANCAAGREVPSDNARLKQTALSVLVQKCNVCHKIYNPGKVFTADNMEALAPKIYKQVFVKRRMPKGREIKLTPEEEQLLREWLETKVAGING